jgi:hypothetical protein
MPPPPRFRLVVPGLSASVLIALSLRIPAPRRFPLELPPTNPANHSFFPTHGFQVPLHATFWATSAVVGGPFSLPLSPLLPLPQHCLRPDTLPLSPLFHPHHPVLDCHAPLVQRRSAVAPHAQAGEGVGGCSAGTFMMGKAATSASQWQPPPAAPWEEGVLGSLFSGVCLCPVEGG